ncbi:MAG: hypothetical protein EOL87_02305 [Spartobacteria bacterium]|nr:hypothetical protein [Spartobacteria bacterium]
MKIQQDQIWKKGDCYYRIVEWARLSIKYKMKRSQAGVEGATKEVTKKEFCRLIKDAELLPPER